MVPAMVAVTQVWQIELPGVMYVAIVPQCPLALYARPSLRASNMDDVDLESLQEGADNCYRL